MTSTNEKVHVGIVGTGRVGIDWHLPDIREAGGEVVALADVVEGRAARFAEIHNVPYAFDDYRELIHHPEVDVVAVCTPPFNHAEITIAALEAGNHVYMEKPPTMNAEEMEAVAEAARTTGKLLLSGSNRIFEHEVQPLKRRIDAGEMGTLYLVEALKLIRRGMPQGWHRRRAYAGGGVGFNSAAHRIDLVLYLLDLPEIISITARTYDHFFTTRAAPESRSYVLRDVEEGLWDETGIDVEDTLVAMIQFGNGCTCVLRDAAAANMPEEWQVRVYGTAAGATLDPLMLYGEADDGLLTDTAVATPPPPAGAHVLAYRHFFECIRTGRPLESTPERSVATMRILDAIYESADNEGREVRLDGT